MVRLLLLLLAQVTVEVTVAAGHPEGEVAVVVVTPSGDSQPGKLLLDARPVPQEKEPNDGFRQANALPLPGVVQGVIANPQDVDVWKFEGKAGQAVVLEVRAARLGSALDSILTVYDERLQVVASKDDLGPGPGGTDSHLELVLPRAGAYYASVQDAHDTGGPAHVYRLVLRPK